MPLWQPYQKSDYPRALRVARHEVGHYIAARTYGYPSGPISLSLQFPDGQQGVNGTILARGTSSLDEVATYLEQRVVCLLAGVNAEVEGLDDKADATLIAMAREGAAHDFAKVRELLHLVRNIRHPEKVSDEAGQKQLDAIEQELVERTVDLLKKESSLVSELAKLLADRVTDWDQKVELTQAELSKHKGLRRFKTLK